MIHFSTTEDVGDTDSPFFLRRVYRFSVILDVEKNFAFGKTKTDLYRGGAGKLGDIPQLLLNDQHPKPVAAF